MHYIRLTISSNPDDQDIIIYHLAELGFEGFEQKDSTVDSYIAEELFNKEQTEAALSAFQATFEIAKMEQKNWNEVWESNFEPVIVDDFVSIRAHFHEPILTTEHQLLITPKMSFGTGHHATTYMMVQQMGQIDFAGKYVFDFGTGTGILAILALKLGAKAVYAIDNEEWSIENAIENAQNNASDSIVFELANSAAGEKTYDIILANINKNVILDNLQNINNQLVAGGDLLLSGLLIEDEQAILDACSTFKLTHISTHNRSQWICIHLKK